MPGKAGTDNLPRVVLNQIAANGHRFKLFSQSSIVSIIGVVPPIEGASDNYQPETGHRLPLGESASYFGPPAPHAHLRQISKKA